MISNATPADFDCMRVALEQARLAAESGEVPIGAVAVKDGVIVATARNRVEAQKSVTAHAEIELLRLVEQQIGDWRMTDFTFYVTKEPCPMCAGALINARVGKIVFGVEDSAFGGCGGHFAIHNAPESVWRCEVIGGVLAEESKTLLRDFFRKAREKHVRE